MHQKMRRMALAFCYRHRVIDGVPELSVRQQRFGDLAVWHALTDDVVRNLVMSKKSAVSMSIHSDRNQ